MAAVGKPMPRISRIAVEYGTSYNLNITLLLSFSHPLIRKHASSYQTTPSAFYLDLTKKRRNERKKKNVFSHPSPPPHTPQTLPPNLPNPTRDSHPTPATPVHLHPARHPLGRIHVPAPHHLAAAHVPLQQGHAQHAALEPVVAETDEHGS